MLRLVGQRRTASRDHFRDEQARENPIFLRDVAANRHARAFFAAQRNLILFKIRTNILKSNRCFENRHIVMLRDCVKKMRGGDAARDAKLPAARLDKVVEDERENMIRRKEGAVAIENAEAIGIAVGGESRAGFSLLERLDERLEVFLGGIGAGAVEKNVALGANRVNLNAMLREKSVEPAGAASVQGVVCKGKLRRGDDVETHELGETFEIWLAQVDRFEVRVFCLRRGLRRVLD